MKPQSVAAIIPAHNEEQTIGPIIEILVASKVFRDIIVISDGSTDQTAEQAEKAGATAVLRFLWKHGKGAAMLRGVAQTNADVLFFCDADLKGLRVEHIQTLLRPVIKGSLSMNVGLRDRGIFLTWCMRHLPLIGGERALARKVFEDIPDRFLQGYMVESALNYYCRSHKLRYGSIALRGLTIRRKMQKVGIVKGTFEYLSMWRQVISAMVLVRLAK